jgi:predicted Zn-dependent protease
MKTSLRRLIVAAALPAALLALAACETVQTTQPGAVGVDRTQRFLVSGEEINKAATLAYSQEMKKAQSKGQLNRDAAQVARARGIVQRLAAASGAFRPDAPKWAWEVNVIGSNEVNAWCMPGGKMAVYSGLIERLKVTDDELAAVMGHEIAHALREHSRERASEQAVQSGLIALGGAFFGIGEGGQQLANVVADVTFGLPHSRAHEVEADRIGVELAARAGYDPRAAVTLWQKMSQAASGGPPQFLSTHPSPENRIRDLQDYSARVMPLYQAKRR